jgi:hypothetical protein
MEDAVRTNRVRCTFCLYISEDARENKDGVTSLKEDRQKLVVFQGVNDEIQSKTLATGRWEPLSLRNYLQVRCCYTENLQTHKIIPKRCLATFYFS